MTPSEPGSPPRFDLDLRPDYWSPDRPKMVILGNGTGKMRKRFLERLIEGDARMAIFIDEKARKGHLSLERRIAEGSPGRDTWPTSVEDLREELALGRQPRPWNGNRANAARSFSSR